MRKTLALLIMVCTTYCINAQNIELGARGYAATFWLLNSASPVTGTSPTKTFSLSYGGGLHLAYDFTDHAGIEFTPMYGMWSQTYSGNYNTSGFLPDGTVYVNGESYTSKIAFTTYQLPLLICFENDGGSFVEIGAEYDMIQAATYSASYSSPDGNRSFNALPAYSNSNIMAIVGFGGKYSLGNNFFILTDFRIQYGLTDMKGVDGQGQTYDSAPFYSSASPTHTLYGSVNLGLFYMIQITQTHKMGHQKCRGPARARG